LSSSHQPADATSDEADHRVDLNPRRDAALVAAGAVAVLAVAIGYRQSPLTAAALVVMLGVSTWLSVIDARIHRLPNRIVGPLAAAAAATVAVAAVIGDEAGGDWGRAARAVGFGAVISAVLLVANLVGGLGMGDVKYGFPVGVTVGWFGLDAVLVTVLATTLAGAVAAIGLLATGRGRSHRLAYGPFMALGTAAGLLSAAPGW
jgi:leader peptidase (prepilin peptidase)/N-methyltransferase